VGSISWKNHYVGAAEGLGLGVLGGAGVGLIVGLLVQGGSHEDFAGLAAFIVVGSAGAVGGLITGVIIGHTYRHEFPADSIR
jgi:hypothetical protein